MKEGTGAEDPLLVDARFRLHFCGVRKPAGRPREEEVVIGQVRLLHYHYVRTYMLPTEKGSLPTAAWHAPHFRPPAMPPNWRATRTCMCQRTILRVLLLV